MKRMARLCSSSTGCCDRSLVIRMLLRVQPLLGHTVYRDNKVTKMAFIITMAMCLPTQERGPQPKGWKKRLGTCHRERVESDLLILFVCFFLRHTHTPCHKIHWTNRSVKVLQAELIGFGEELGLMHETDVEDDVGSFPDLRAVNVVVLKSLSHGEVNHRLEPQRLVNEALQHFQVLIINVFCTFIPC